MDDIVILNNSAEYVKAMLKSLSKQLKERGGDMTDLGVCKHYCGVKVEDLGSEVRLSVNKYMKGIVDTFGDGLSVKHMPYPSTARITRGSDATIVKVDNPGISIPSFVGSLRFASRIDFRGQFACTALGPSQAKATPEGVAICEHHVGYIKGHGLGYLSYKGTPKDPTKVELQGFCDISYAVFEGRSIGSCIVTLNGNTILPTSKWTLVEHSVNRAPGGGVD